MKLKDKLPEEYIKGLKDGLKIAKNVANRQGYEIIFPDVSEMTIEHIKKTQE